MIHSLYHRTWEGDLQCANQRRGNCLDIYGWVFDRAFLLTPKKESMNIIAPAAQEATIMTEVTLMRPTLIIKTFPKENK